MENNGNFDWHDYTQRYRANHPEKTLRWRINTAINLLRRYGFVVIEPPQETAEDGDNV